MLLLDEVEGDAAGRRSVARAIAWTLLVLLLAIDLMFVACHLFLVGAPEVFEHAWSVEADTGYAEKFQHLKWLAAVVLLLILALTRRAAVYLAWAAIFLYFLVDDATSIHETQGGRLAVEFGLERVQQIYAAWFPAFYLRPQDFGELAVALFAAAAIAFALILCWPRNGAVRERLVAKRLVAWLALFAFFAVGFDMLHIMAMDPVTMFTPAFYWLGVIEDGGEMLCASILVGGLALELTRASRRSGARSSKRGRRIEALLPLG